MLNFYTPPNYTPRMPSNTLWSKKLRKTPAFFSIFVENSSVLCTYLLTADSIACSLFLSKYLLQLACQWTSRETLDITKKKDRATTILQLLWLLPLVFIFTSLLVHIVAILSPFHLVASYRHPSLLSYTTHWVLLLHILTITLTRARRPTGYMLSWKCIFFRST